MPTHPSCATASRSPMDASLGKQPSRCSRDVLERFASATQPGRRRRRAKRMRVAVIGVGLIGGSIGLAARARAGAEVCGFDPDPRVRELALARGVIDREAVYVELAGHGAEAIF